MSCCNLRNIIHCTIGVIWPGPGLETSVFSTVWYEHEYGSVHTNFHFANMFSFSFCIGGTQQCLTDILGFNRIFTATVFGRQMNKHFMLPMRKATDMVSKTSQQARAERRQLELQFAMAIGRGHALLATSTVS